VTNEEQERLQALVDNQAMLLEQGRRLIERALAWLAQAEQNRRLLLERLKGEP
jgi:hypothetical protein